MNRFRQRNCFSSYVALFAIAFQLFVSFGHIHKTEIASTDTTIGLTERAGLAQNQNERTGDIPGDTHDRCSICAIIHLAGSLVVPDQPLSELRQTNYFVLVLPSISAPISRAEQTPFQSRAPPSQVSV